MNSVNIPEIYLYGCPTTGFGWIAQANIRQFGDGVPVATWSPTDAVSIACLQLRIADFGGPVFIYSPDGRSRALTTIESPRDCGSLTWSPAPVLEISADEILDAETPMFEDYYGGE